ncbi:MAG: hypothetical protein ACRELB_02220, partial [Polyangiaceae bacterium]
MRPPFDPEQFARESDSRLKVADRASSPLGSGSPSGVILASDAPPDLQEEVGGAEGLGLDLDSVPLLAASREELEWVDLSDEASALVAYVDGVATLEEIAVK